MSDIEGLGYPLVYKAAENAPVPSGLNVQDDNITIRTAVRCLTGMQKEALVYYGPSGTAWRMVSDEGPYLNGTDLAPFPLAFYTTGMVFSFMQELLKHAAAAGVAFDNLEITQDNYYTMEGSALRGDMIGGALPVEICVKAETAAAADVMRQLAARAEHSSPPQRYMTEALVNTFGLNHNGRTIPVSDVTESSGQRPNDPTGKLEQIQPLADGSYHEDIIIKQKAAESVFGVEGGAGSSLQATQKRTLHVRGICTLRPDGLKEAIIQLFKPLGSTFRFLGDDTGQERAPSSLAYLAAGVGFCFMTQIGRYAHITKQDLKAYSIVQDTIYQIGTTSSKAAPVDTHTFLRTGEPDEVAQKTLYMSERTCFLHAAMRGTNQTRIRIE
jgi:hypothetical protein